MAAAGHKEGEEEEEECFHEADSQSLLAVDEVDKVYQRVHVLESIIMDMFSTVSALKNAYIQLQAAHSPYDPEKLRAADKLVIGELRKLSEIKNMFRGKLTVRSHTNGSAKVDETLARKVEELQSSVNEKQGVVESYERYMEACHKEIHDKNEEIERLNESLKRANSKREKLEKRLRGFSSSNASPLAMNGSFISLTPPLFEQATQGAREHAFGFAKLLIGLMKNVGWDLEAAANSIQPGVVYARPGDTNFAFQSYVCHRMFNGFENENFYLSGSLSSILDPGKHRQDCLLQFQDMRSMDPVELLSVTPDCLFGKFCQRKYLQIVHEKMEESFFGNLEQRHQVLNGEHPRSQFYQTFLELAKCVWLVHRLAFSFNPTVSIFQVRKDTEFHPDFMESAVELEQENDVKNMMRPKVGFTVMPGFRLESAVAKCLVYLNRD